MIGLHLMRKGAIRCPRDGHALDARGWERQSHHFGKNKDIEDKEMKQRYIFINRGKDKPNS